MEAEKGKAAPRTSPLDILSKEGCKVQSFTVSESHATLLVSYPELIVAGEDRGGASGDEQGSASTTATCLLKLTLVPFHKSLLGSNPVISPEDIEKGQQPERNALRHDPRASEEILSFLKGYDYKLKSESGAEYSYYAASPGSDLNTSFGVDKSDIQPPAKKRAGDAKASEKDEVSVSTAVSSFGCFDVELISPASPYQISRAMPSLGHVMVRETPEMYEAVVRPYIRSVVDGGSLSWIANVVEGKKERERLLVDDGAFVVNVDTKWRSHPPPLKTPREEWRGHPSTEDLYCLGIVKDSGIACLRDLRGEHVPLLRRMEAEGLRAIKAVYGVDADQIRVFIHYQPQFYHLHLHFTRLENEIGCAVERGHMVCDVVENLEMDSDYYLKRNISYKLKRGTPLMGLIERYKNDSGEKE